MGKLHFKTETNGFSAIKIAKFEKYQLHSTFLLHYIPLQYIVTKMFFTSMWNETSEDGLERKRYSKTTLIIMVQ